MPDTRGGGVSDAGLGGAQAAARQPQSSRINREAVRMMPNITPLFAMANHGAGSGGIRA